MFTSSFFIVFNMNDMIDRSLDVDRSINRSINMIGHIRTKKRKFSSFAFKSMPIEWACP